MKNVAQIRKLDLLADILHWLLARSSKLWTLEELCAATQISKDTAKRYVSALKALTPPPRKQRGRLPVKTAVCFDGKTKDSPKAVLFDYIFFR